jgi:hypothetical protein
MLLVKYNENWSITLQSGLPYFKLQAVNTERPRVIMAVRHVAEP